MALISCEWKQPIKKDYGILCGADQSQEWLLPWWWSRYQERHHFPVTFCDFGLSIEMRNWCAERGDVVSVGLDPACVVARKDLPSSLVSHGESVYGEGVWTARLHWFKKPFALLQSPYKVGIWMDVDCEILGHLDPLFFKLDSQAELALVRETPFFYQPFLHPDTLYNGGVVVFRHGSVSIQKWAEAALVKNHLFLGDDQLLSHLIYEQRFPIQELPEIYNWKLSQGVNLAAVVLHWVAGGKEYIRSHGGLKPLLDEFFLGFHSPS